MYLLKRKAQKSTKKQRNNSKKADIIGEIEQEKTNFMFLENLVTKTKNKIDTLIEDNLFLENQLKQMMLNNKER